MRGERKHRRYGGAFYPVVVATDPIMVGDELTAVVERVRRRLRADGGKRAPVVGVFESPLDREASAVLLELLRDGTYRAAVEQVVAEDPELADQ